MLWFLSCLLCLCLGYVIGRMDREKESIEEKAFLTKVLLKERNSDHT